MQPIRRFVIILAVAACSFGPAFAQETGRPEFEVASIKPTAPAKDDRVTFGVHIDGAMVMVHSYSVKDCIMFAYNVREYQISGPDWLDSQKFDISAKFPEGVPRKQLALMMQSLLADRFKVALRVEKKAFPIYALVVSKNGLKLKPSQPIETGGSSGDNKGNVNVGVVVTSGANTGRGSSTVDLGNGAFISSSNGRIEGHAVTMDHLVETLWRYVDRPVVDMTGLTGAYDLSLAYGIDELRNLLRVSHVDRQIPDGALPPASIFDSLKTVGLELDARKAPIDFVVVDHAERMPTAN